MKKQIYLNAFDMNCVGHQSPGLWTHPDDESYKYKDLSYWTELAQLLEKGKFDGIFIADVLGIYDVYQDSKIPAVRQAAQVPVNDPLLIVSAMAQATEHIGFGVTVALTFEHPYIHARRLSTLDHLTKGRVGWNIVTSYLESAARNIGLENQIQHDQRYDIAEEYLEVCYKLWEGSWEDGAVLRDRKNKVFTDPDKVHEINHQGKYFKVPGIHLCEPSPQRTPVLYQAGTSSRGRAFAAKNAECVFVAGPSVESIKGSVQDLRKQAKEFGRNSEDIKVFSLFTPIVGRTEQEAWDKYNEYVEHISYEGALALLSGWTGIDFSEYDPNQNLEYVESNAIQSAVEVLTQSDPNKVWTVRELAIFAGIGGMGPIKVGTPEQIADTLEYWVEEAGVDGFNIAYAITPGTFKDFVELVVPELQRRGLFKEEYGEGTLREKLFEKSAYLSNEHPGANYRQLLIR